MWMQRQNKNLVVITLYYNTTCITVWGVVLFDNLISSVILKGYIRLSDGYIK